MRAEGRGCDRGSFEGEIASVVVAIGHEICHPPTHCVAVGRSGRRGSHQAPVRLAGLHVTHNRSTRFVRDGVAWHAPHICTKRRSTLAPCSRLDRPSIAPPPRPRTSTPRAIDMIPVLKMLRPHQWAKNLLLVLPAGAGHVALTPSFLAHLGGGFAAMSLMASSVYIANDWLDVESDRLHPRKRHRPIASGKVSLQQAAIVAILCASTALALAWWVSPLFLYTLMAYAVLTSAYSAWLKKVLLVDVLVLACLYTVRVVGGAVIADVRLSRWFLAFSIFLFFSLALVKRVRELREVRAAGADENQSLPGRAYRPVDQNALLSLGSAATMATALVWCLYVTSEDALLLYARPDALWLGLPLLIYWQARVWIFTLRDAMHDDPVAFALRDRVSWLTGACFILSLLLASK
ncbi:MAG TPA: UbiA family prenyltransferase [Gemmatimonadaceae bacterium]|nr:UbiA family prenyltransferase [Gemmatimonadaceae bacterium]